ncbi:MAG: hypothetical protein QOI91_1826 [Solirubrobacteraceae bacterium]|jgi:hypothetical protein|nr:hypothetical protein [Solirubrobacteraceae bacterium]
MASASKGPKRSKRTTAKRSGRAGPSLTLDLEALRAKRLDPEAAGPDDPGGRAEYFLESRVDGKGRIPRRLFFNASRIRRQLDRELLAPGPHADRPAPPGGMASVNWTPLGPSVIPHGQPGTPPVSGRVRSLAVGVSGARVYAGAANGGVWLSENGGVSWRPLDDYAVSPGTTSGLEADSLAVGSIAVTWGTTQATDTIYVGTGEPTGGDAYLGIGVKRSASGGAPGTWTLEGTNLAGRAFHRIAVDPEDTSIVLAATSAGLYRRPASGSPASWTQITSPAFPSAEATDILVAGAGAAKRYYVAFAGAVAVSSDLITWTVVTGAGSASRTLLAAGQSDPSVVYALGSNGLLARLSGGSFQAVSGIPQALFFGAQGYYDMLLAVDPADANTVYLGGDAIWDGGWALSLFKGTITGGPGAWSFPFNSANDVFVDAQGSHSDNVPNDPTWIGRGIHADGHAIAFAAAAGGGYDGTRVWIGCDGGVFASASSGARGTFAARNTGLAITEMEYLAQRPDTDAVLFAGAQDNGTVRSWGEEAWAEVVAGDGGATLIDPNDPYRVMRQYVRSVLSTADDGGISGIWTDLTFPPLTANTAAQASAWTAEYWATRFYAPLAASPAGVSPTLAAFGTTRLWLTANWGATWVTLPTGTNPYVPATPSATQDQLDGTSVTGVVFASGTRIYVSTFAAVWRFDLSGGTWARTPLPTTGLPASPNITDLAADPSGNVYAALGGSGKNHLWYYNGTSWLAAGPPQTTLDVPCHAVVVDPANPNVVFLGSDVGCWRGVKSGSNWAWVPFSQGLPEVAITDLGVHERARLLRAATHGRGVWEYPLDAATGQNPEIYLRVNSADTGRVIGGTRFPWVEGAPDPTRKGSNVYHWMSADIKVRRGSLMPLPVLSSSPDFGDFAANIGDYRDTQNVETADVTASNRVFVEVHNRALDPIDGALVRVLLLMTDAYAGLPALPTGYAAKLNAGDTTNWVATSQWRFADPMMPYRWLPGPLEARVPQVVEFPLNVSPLMLPFGHDHVCVAAFVTTGTDRLTSTEPSLDVLTMHDRHAAHRNLHVVAAGARPIANGGLAHEPTTVVLGVANAGRRAKAADLVFDRREFPGHLSILLPRRAGDGVKLDGFTREKPGGLGEIQEHVEAWHEELRERLERRVELLGADSQVKQLSALDLRRPLVAEPKGKAALRGLTIPPGEAIWTAITLQAPEDARPGDSFSFNVIQRAGRRIVGGSTYMVGVRKPQ